VSSSRAECSCAVSSITNETRTLSLHSTFCLADTHTHTDVNGSHYHENVVIVELLQWPRALWCSKTSLVLHTAAKSVICLSCCLAYSPVVWLLSDSARVIYVWRMLTGAWSDGTSDCYALLHAVCSCTSLRLSFSFLISCAVYNSPRRILWDCSLVELSNREFQRVLRVTSW
jgi:hypothetical protein